MTFEKRDLVHRAVRSIREYIGLCISEHNTYYLARANQYLDDMWDLRIINLKEKRAFERIINRVRKSAEQGVWEALNETNRKNTPGTQKRTGCV